MIDYHGKRVLVTGAASGIGKALAEVLAARGATLVLADVDEAALQAIATALGAEAVVCDLAEATAPGQLIATASLSGPLDLVCSNAGIGRRKRILKETADHEVSLLFAINLSAGIKLAQAYAAMLGANARGRIMFTASENSLSMPQAVKGGGLGMYAASKHALLAAAEWLRDEAAESLDVHVLLPGPVYTPLIAKAIPNPANAPPGVQLISAERCAEIALQGMDNGLFYIPTHAHLVDDMRSRTEGIAAAARALGLTPPNVS